MHSLVNLLINLSMLYNAKGLATPWKFNDAPGEACLPVKNRCYKGPKRHFLCAGNNAWPNQWLESQNKYFPVVAAMVVKPLLNKERATYLSFADRLIEDVE